MGQRDTFEIIKEKFPNKKFTSKELLPLVDVGIGSLGNNLRKLVDRNCLKKEKILRTRNEYLYWLVK